MKMKLYNVKTVQYECKSCTKGIWEIIPELIKGSESTEEFKTKIKKFPPS